MRGQAATAHSSSRPPSPRKSLWMLKQVQHDGARGHAAARLYPFPAKAGTQPLRHALTIPTPPIARTAPTAISSRLCASARTSSPLEFRAETRRRRRIALRLRPTPPPGQSLWMLKRVQHDGARWRAAADLYCFPAKAGTQPLRYALTTAAPPVARPAPAAISPRLCASAQISSALEASRGDAEARKEDRPAPPPHAIARAEPQDAETSSA